MLSRPALCVTTVTRFRYCIQILHTHAGKYSRICLYRRGSCYSFSRVEGHGLPPFALSATNQYTSPSFPSQLSRGAGYYAGFLSSAFMIGRMFSAYAWGHVADRWGRRPVMLCGLFCIAALSLAFGLSTSLAWAIVCRWGQLLDG